MSKPLNEILARLMQLRGIAPEQVPGKKNWDLLIEDLSEYLSDLEKDRDMLEKSLEVTSKAVEERWQHQDVLEKDLMETEAELRALYDASPLGMFISDEKANISYVNRTFYDITGYSSQSAIENDWIDFVHPDDRPNLLEAWAKLAERPDSPFDCEVRFLNKERDEVIWIHLRISAIYFDKSLKGFLGTVDNISERKKAESLLVGEKQVLEMIARNLPLRYALESLIHMIEAQIIGAKGTIFLLDDKNFLKFAGSASLEQEVIDTIYKIKVPFSPNDYQTSMSHGQKFLLQCVKDNAGWSPFLKEIKHFGYHCAFVSPIIGSTNDVVGVIALLFQSDKELKSSHHETTEFFTDLLAISIERKLFQENLEREQMRVISSSKMASLGEMAGGISHEIMNPLAIIDGFALRIERMIGNKKIDPDTLLHYAEKIRSTVSRVTKIISSLRAFAREGDRDDFESQPLKKIIDDTLEFCHQKIKHRGISLIIKDYDPTLHLDCRPVQISQVLLNLLNNATDAVEELGEKWIKIEVIDDDYRVKIKVTDSGHGIKEENLEKIMKPFFTTKPVGKGTGLGLSVSKSLIESHNGNLLLDRTIPNTCFIIELPKHQEKKKAA